MRILKKREEARKYKIKLKIENPEKYEELLEKKRIYKRKYKENMTAEQRIKYNESKNRRERNHRKKLRESGLIY